MKWGIWKVELAVMRCGRVYVKGSACNDMERSIEVLRMKKGVWRVYVDGMDWES